MKQVKLYVGIAINLVEISAIYLLWQDDTFNSLLVAGLLVAVIVIPLILAISVLPQLMNHRAWPFGDIDAACKEIVGNKWQPVRRLAELCVLVVAIYMIYTGNGMRGCGELLAGLIVLHWVLGAERGAL